MGLQYHVTYVGVLATTMSGMQIASKCMMYGPACLAVLGKPNKQQEDEKSILVDKNLLLTLCSSLSLLQLQEYILRCRILVTLFWYNFIFVKNDSMYFNLQANFK